jgi:hypothetical protein
MDEVIRAAILLDDERAERLPDAPDDLAAEDAGDATVPPLPTEPFGDNVAADA